MADRVGQQLGNYRLMQLLGRGGFAEVYLGQHVRLNTQTAIKVLHTQLADEDIQHFQDEAQTIANLEHPNIVRLQDFDVQNGTPFLVMQYASNGSLRQRHPKGTRVPLETVVRYVQQTSEALQFAHDRRLVHRDVKPENLLLGRRDEVLLSDFGIALIVQSSRYQSTQEVVGTILYMAPEQIQGKPRPASDQYSLGVMIYEWLVGERPFQGSMSEVVAQHLSVPPPPLAGRVPGLSPSVEQVMLTALAKDPQDRFVSVKAFATAFSQASLMDQPTRISGPSAAVIQPVVPRPTAPISDLPPTTPLPPAVKAEPAPKVPSSSWEQATLPVARESIALPMLPTPAPSGKPSHIGRTLLVGLLLISMLAGGVFLGLSLAKKNSVALISPTPTSTSLPTATPIPTSTSLPTATSTRTTPQQNISGLWNGESGSNVKYSFFLTQSGSAISGNGSKSDGATLSVSGSIDGYSVVLTVFVIRDSCYQHDTLTLSADYQSMSGYLQSDCNGAILTFILNRQ